MLRRKRGRYCPKCGASLRQRDLYCTSCGYSFKRRRRGFNLKNLIIVIIIFLVVWTIIRMIVGKPVVPQPLLDIIKNSTARG